MDKLGYRAKVRRFMRDDLTVGPKLFTDDDIDAAVQEARDQAALRGRLCPIDWASSPSVGRIVLADGVFEYDIDPTVFRIAKASFLGRPLSPSTEREFDFCRVYQTPRLGNPCSYYVSDERKLVFDKCPAVAAGAVVLLEGFKTPDPLVLDTDVDLEILGETNQTNLLYRAYSRLYLIQDSEVNHIEKSQFFEAEFIKLFGREKSANELREQFRSADRQIAYGGIPDGRAIGGHRRRDYR